MDLKETGTAKVISLVQGFFQFFQELFLADISAFVHALAKRASKTRKLSKKPKGLK